MNDEKNIRVFVAIDPPADVLENIEAMCRRLKKTIQGMIRWVRPAGIHLTLKFFGDISTQDVHNISGIIAKKTTSVPPFNLEIRGLGAFPEVKRPRVIWLGITGQVGELVSLQRGLEDEFFNLGFLKEERPFQAHLTIGRVRVPKGINGLIQAVETGRSLTVGKFQVTEAALIKSNLSPQGAIYTKLATFPFQG